MPAEINKIKIPLRYLFKALLQDGTIFEQTLEDKSKIDPEKRNAFYDLLQADAAGNKIVTFGIFGVNEKKALVVDLRDGHFELNGTILIHGEVLPGPIPLKLIYYRAVEQDLQVTYKVKTGEVLKEVAGDHRDQYFVGWEANFNGKSYKQVLGLN